MQQIQDGRGLRNMAEAVAGDGNDKMRHGYSVHPGLIRVFWLIQAQRQERRLLSLKCKAGTACC
jgi:hypothetical protein